MASSMSGMFPGQQTSGQIPVAGPGGAGQPGFSGVGGPGPRVPGNNTLVDELEASFEAARGNPFVCGPGRPIVYTWNQLLGLGNPPYGRAAPFHAEKPDIPADIRRRRRGCRGGRTKRRTCIPSVVMGNVKSLRNKTEELVAQTRFQRLYRDCSLMACFASLVSQDYVNGTDQEEIRTGVDQCIQKFLDVARQTECFFLQKRLQLSVQKPEQVVKEDVSELRNELQRKEILVQKHLAKLHHWQQVLEDVSGQQRKPTDLPPPGPLAFLEQASASLPPAPLKPN